jgi:hypothetical protein
MSAAKNREKNCKPISGEMIAKSIASSNNEKIGCEFNEKDALAHLILQQESIVRTLQHMRKEQKKQIGTSGCMTFASLCKDWAVQIVANTYSTWAQAYSLLSACSAVGALDAEDDNLESGEIIYAAE